MTNRIVGALEHAATRLGKTLGEDAGKAVKDLYHSTGHNLTGIAEDTTAADLKHETALRALMRDSKQTSVHAPHEVSDPAHLPHEDGHEPPLGGEHVPGQPSEGNSGCTTGGDPVDVVSGQMITSATDVDLSGLLPLVLRRAYASGYSGGRWFGPGWASTLDQRVQIDASGVHYAGEDAEIQHYPLPTAERPQVLPERGAQRRLTWDRETDTIRIEDTATGWTRHFAAPERRSGSHTRTITALTDRNGNHIEYLAGPDGLPMEVRHSGGYHLAVDTIGTLAGPRIGGLRLLRGDDGGGGTQLVRYAYDDRGRLTSITDSTGLPLAYQHDLHDRITSWTDRNGHWYAYEYGPSGRVVHGHGPQGALEARFAYDLANRVTTVTNSLGARTEYHYDHYRHLTRTVDPLGGTVHTKHDRFGRLLSRTDELGHTTRLVRDSQGDVVRVDRPDGTAVQFTYNPLRLPVEVIAPDRAIWQQAYDAAGNCTEVTDPAGAVTRYTYDSSGRLTSVTNALGNTAAVRCDQAGLPIEITDPLGGTTCYSRDVFGRVVSVTDSLGGTTRLERDAKGKVLRRVGPDGPEERWEYDGEGNCVARTDAVGGVTRYEYTHFSLLTAQTTPDGARYDFTHDTELRLTQVTNPQGLTWTYGYDPAGRLASENDFDSRTLRYGYDAAGHLTARTNDLGQTIGYEHDLLGNLVAKTADSHTTTYQYDPAGRLTHATGPDATLTWQHDASGRITAETSNGYTLTHAYDALGRRTRRTTPSGAVSIWTYDAANRPASLSAAGRMLAFDRDVLGREISRRLDGGLTLLQDWDPAGRLIAQSLAAESPSGTSLMGESPEGGQRTGVLQARTYTYRADGYLAGVDDQLAGTRSFDLDRVGRVTAVRAQDWTETYAYDATGNQTHAAWPDTHPDVEATGPRTFTGTRITRAGAIRYEHDAAGRITLRQKARQSRRPETWRYTWDAEDRLISVTTPEGTVWRYLYDPLGRRTAKQRLAAEGEVVEEIRFTWDGVTLAEQTSAGGTPHPVTLTWDHQGLHPLAQTERITDTATQREIDQRFFAIVTDLIGTPTELVDESGDIAWRARRTLWGTTTWPTTSTAYTPLRFPGQYHDPETGLHYNLQRYYDPATARYTTPDPLGLTPAPNPVSYVRNPHTWADPLGLTACDTSPSAGASRIPVYRGTDRYMENDIAANTGRLMSEAAQRAYVESGGSIEDAMRASQAAHAAALAEWGGPESLAHAHAEFGTEMQQAYGPRSVMSFTTDPETAKLFANGGPVYRAMINPSQGIWQTLPGSGESEVLIPHMIEVEPWAG